MAEASRQPKPVTVTVEGEDPRDVQMWLGFLDRMLKVHGGEITIARLHPSSFVIQPKVK